MATRTALNPIELSIGWASQQPIILTVRSFATRNIWIFGILFGTNRRFDWSGNRPTVLETSGFGCIAAPDTLNAALNNINDNIGLHTVQFILGRPTYMSADLRFTADSFFLSKFFLFFVSNQRSSLNGTSPAAAWSEVSAIWKCTAEMWGMGIPFPTNRGPNNHLFSTISQLKGKFNGRYLRNETW